MGAPILQVADHLSGANITYAPLNRWAEPAQLTFQVIVGPVDIVGTLLAPNKPGAPANVITNYSSFSVKDSTGADINSMALPVGIYTTTIGFEAIAVESAGAALTIIHQQGGC